MKNWCGDQGKAENVPAGDIERGNQVAVLRENADTFIAQHMKEVQDGKEEEGDTDEKIVMIVQYVPPVPNYDEDAGRNKNRSDIHDAVKQGIVIGA